MEGEYPDWFKRLKKDGLNMPLNNDEDLTLTKEQLIWKYAAIGVDISWIFIESPFFKNLIDKKNENKIPNNI